MYKIEDLLAKLQKEKQFEFVVISNKKPTFKKLRFTYVEWNEISEIEDLLKFNIGIMPLENNKWAKGKCGFKAIQYMSLGIPAVVSDVGVNSKIVDNDFNGFLCNNDNDWKTAINELWALEKRIEFGKKAQIKIQELYSTESQKENYFSLIFPE